MVELFDEILNGRNAPTPMGLLRVSASEACRRLPGMPYSIATNLAHANRWQSYWLARLRGDKRSSLMEQWKEDWHEPTPAEWPALRKSFIDGVAEARDVAASSPFRHGAKTDRDAVRLLVAIATHSAYHLGQMNLLKRALRAAR